MFCQMEQMASRMFPIPVRYKYYVLLVRWMQDTLTSLQTNASNGIVVNMFKPNANRAMLMNVLSDGKLFKILPVWVRCALVFLESS